MGRILKCPGCDREIRTGKTRDLNKHMNLNGNIVVSRNCFCICQNISAHFGFSIFPILMDIKKPPSILAIESKNSNNFGYNFGH